MRHRLIKAGRAFCWAIVLTLIVSWIAGIWCLHQVYYSRGKHGYLLCLGAGAIAITHDEWEWETGGQVAPGFHFSVVGIPHYPKYAIWPDIRGNFANNSGSHGIRRWRYISVPYWAIVLPLSILPLMDLIRLRRQLHRLREGLCATCGYDLRASPDRCPECGAPASALRTRR
jgi:hypothetical protein